jgi:hypothetical protein
MTGAPRLRRGFAQLSFFLTPRSLSIADNTATGITVHQRSHSAPTKLFSLRFGCTVSRSVQLSRSGGGVTALGFVL